MEEEKNVNIPEVVVDVDSPVLAIDENVGDSDCNIVFHISDFDGPLDLLIALIKKNKMEIETVELSKITEQYLELMNQVEKLDMDAASDFIEMAATLIEIKSKALLPKAEEELDEEDPEELLRQRMLEYEMFKNQASVLKPMDNVNRFYRAPDKQASKFRIVIKDMQLDLLLDAFSKLMVRIKKEVKEEPPKEIKKEQFTVAEKIATLKDTLIIKSQVNFSELFENSSSRNEIITTFMALLELLKLQEIKVVQLDNFADIVITKSEPEDDVTEIIATSEEN